MVIESNNEDGCSLYLLWRNARSNLERVQSRQIDDDRFLATAGNDQLRGGVRIRVLLTVRQVRGHKDVVTGIGSYAYFCLTIEEHELRMAAADVDHGLGITVMMVG